MDGLSKFPTSPHSLASLCMQKVWLEELPVLDLPVTPQRDVAKLAGGQFVRKKIELTPAGFIPLCSSQIALIKNPEGFQIIFGSGLMPDLFAGEFETIDNFGTFRRKGWVEAGTILQFRYVWKLVHRDGFQQSEGWRIVFTEKGLTVTMEAEWGDDNATSYIKEEAEYEKI